MLRTALQHHQAGRLTEAQQLYRRILAMDARHADSLHLLGVIAFQGGRYDLAVDLIGQAIRLCNANTLYLHSMGKALYAQGRTDEAVAHYKRALAVSPDDADVHNSLGVALWEQGNSVDAMAHYVRTLTVNPNHSDAHNNLGNVLAAQGRIADAMAHYERAISLKPDYADAHNNMGIVLAAQGRTSAAVAHYERALILNPDNANAHSNLSVALLAQNNFDDAMARGERAVAINPQHAEAHNHLGSILAVQGRFDDAMEHFGRAIAIRPDYAEAHFNRAQIKTFQHDDAELAALYEFAGREDLSANQALHIHFALAKALEDCGDYARAFEHLKKGNVLKRRQIVYNEIDAVRYFQRIAMAFDNRLFVHFQGQGDPSDVPIFVLGMPRSGSTLIEQILASHPQIQSAGEFAALHEVADSVPHAGNPAAPYPECLSALDGHVLRHLGQSYLARLPALGHGQVRIIDKTPANFLGIGLIRLILPNAKIIHTMRDPVDTCISCYSKLFTSGVSYSYDLAELGRFYYCYRELMKHWRSVLPPHAMLDVAYEAVVDDLEGQARRMIEYCGLPWDDGCLSFHESRRPVKTASAAQVRKPLFRTSLQRWRRYGSELAPLLHELGFVAPQAR